MGALDFTVTAALFHFYHDELEAVAVKAGIAALLNASRCRTITALSIPEPLAITKSTAWPA